MIKTRYKLNPIHKLTCVFLIAVGIMFLVQPQAYSVKVESDELNDVEFSFLHAGDYEIEAAYEDSPAGNAILIYTENLTSSDNQPQLEIYRQEIEAGSAALKIAFHLDEDAYVVQVKTALDDEEQYYLSQLRLQSVQLLSRDNYFIFALCFLAAFVVFAMGMFLPQEKYQGPFLLTVLGLGASVPLFNNFAFSGHDLRFHIARISGLAQGLLAGEFPVRINSIQLEQLGSLSATMYPQLFLYPIALLHIAGVSVMVAYKVLLVCINIGSAFTSFYSVKAITKSEKAGWVASVLYTFSLWRLIDEYFRAALGEALAMVFMPLILWGAYEVFWRDHRKWYVLMLGMTGVVQSHVLSVELCMIFLLIEAFIWLFSPRGKEKLRRIVSGVKAAVGTLLLNAAFLIPFLFYLREDFNSLHLSTKLVNHAVYFSQMFSFFPVAAGISLKQGTTAKEMPLTIGGVLGIGSVLFLIAVWKKWERNELSLLGGRCLCYGILAILLASWIFPWKEVTRYTAVFNITAPLQFAWRFLTPASMLLCVTSACGTVMLEERTKNRGICVAMVVIAFCSAAYFFDSMTYQANQKSDKLQMEASRVTDTLYMYEGTTDDMVNPGCIVVSNGTETDISDYEKIGSSIRVHVSPKYQGEDAQEDYLVFPLYYYPGYVVKVNGEKVETFAKDALVACRMPETDADIYVSFEGFALFRIADILSLVTALGMAGYALAGKQRKAAKKR